MNLMKHRLIILLGLLIFSLEVQSQYDEYIKSLISVSNDTFARVELERNFFIERNTDSLSVEGYAYSIDSINLKYYPKQKGNPCSYFCLNGELFSFEGSFPESKRFGCRLDYSSFDFFTLDFENRKYFLLTTIPETSGSGTKNVFFHLFVLDESGVKYFPMWSMYGTHLNLGDYNSDGLLDFIETRYDVSKSDNQFFKSRLLSLSPEHNRFTEEGDNYILFKREYDDDYYPIITILDKQWPPPND